MAIDFPPQMGRIIYEYDYFCMAKDTPILCRGQDGQVSLKPVQEISHGDMVVSINKETSKQEWKSVRLHVKETNDSMLSIRAKTQFIVSKDHKMILPDFSEESAGNLERGTYLLGVSKIELPSDTERLDLLSSIGPPPEWVVVDENSLSYLRKRGRGKGKLCIEGKIDRYTNLTYDFGLFLGLYLAEGSCFKNTTIFSLSEHEPELSGLIELLSEKCFGLRALTKVFSQYTRRTVFIHNKMFSYLWRSLIPGDCYSKSLPAWAFSAPEDFKLGVIQGWLLGDGSVSDRTVFGKTTSQLLAYGIHTLALSLGIESSISQEKRVFILTFSTAQNIKRLCLEKTAWKHTQRVEEIISNGWDNSEEYFREKFSRFYKLGISKDEFIKASHISEQRIRREFGSWANFLYEMGAGGSALKCRGLTKDQILEIAHEWLKGNTFSILAWDSDPSTPSQGAIRKYFSGVEDFLEQAKGFIKTEAAENNNSLIPKKITRCEEVKYEEDFVYDLEVEDNHNFLIGGVVSHNSGSQVMVYFSDVLVDDICRIAWGVTQNRQPIYGYASQYFAALAAGVVIGGGSFWIAFKEAAYIPAILNYLGSRLSGEEDDIYPSPAIRPSSAQRVTANLVGSAQIFEGTFGEGGVRQSGSITRANIETTLNANNQNPDDAETQARLMQYAANIAALPDREFEDMAEFFEDAVWYGGGSNAEGMGRREAASGNWTGGADENSLMLHRRADQYPPFDIIVAFGDINNAASNHTVVRLADVTITDTKFVGIETSGDPIAVQYDFIFRNHM